MATVNESMSTINGWLGDAVRLGMSLVGAFLVVDILFPGTTGIVANVGALVTSFTGQGITGIVALIVFMAVLRR
ncbi:MAG: hypothetical protein QF412_03765 [Planctomycetota bacterium]|jgi:hypothetical protein|nr:hypothetical protein [Planctomycetota bacterium]